MVKNLTATLMLLPLMAISAGCKAQAPPASPGYKVSLTWTAPAASGTWAGCTTAAPCAYAVYAETLVSGSTCDPSTSTNFKEITTSATRPSSPAYTDASATGLDRCYLVETVQGSQNSAPSNIVNVSVPGIPLAPTLGSPTVAENNSPSPVTLASASAPPMPANLHAIASR
jgi:hypothetical protein